MGGMAGRGDENWSRAIRVEVRLCLREIPIAQWEEESVLEGRLWNRDAAGLEEGWRWGPQSCWNVPAPLRTGLTGGASRFTLYN